MTNSAAPCGYIPRKKKTAAFGGDCCSATTEAARNAEESALK